MTKLAFYFGKKNRFDMFSTAKPNFRLITGVFILVYIFSTLMAFLEGLPKDFIILSIISWLFAYMSAIIQQKIFEFLSIFFRLKWYSFLWVFPICERVCHTLDRITRNTSSYSGGNNVFEALDWFFIGINALVDVFLVFLFFSKNYRHNINRLLDIPSDPSEKKDRAFRPLKKPEEVIGMGTSINDNVITSILFRAVASNRMSNFSLTVMVILVFIGGSASVGTVALNQFSKIRELEKHRIELLNLQGILKETINKHKVATVNGMINNPISYSLIVEDSIALQKISDEIRIAYGDDKTYAKFLENLEKQSAISIPEITMRIAIAALTLFLVQVFFHIYRFNQQHSANLFTKAEVLELFNDEDADKKHLREVLVSKLEQNPKFGKSPSTPVEQIINIADRAK